MYRKERDGAVRGNDTGNQIKVDKIESEERTTLNSRKQTEPTYYDTHFVPRRHENVSTVDSTRDRQRVPLPLIQTEETENSRLSKESDRNESLQKESIEKKEKVVSETKSTGLPAQESFYMKPYVGKFSGSDPVPKSESSFEDWKLEVESLIEPKIYPDISIAQAIRKSLIGQAKSVLHAMGPKARPEDMIKRLESVFGNVASGEAVLQEFYTAEQRADESTVDWGLRLENILQRAIEDHVSGDKNEMLKSKFWRSLYNQDLKNATKMYRESIKDFEQFRKKVREEEYEMKKVVIRQSDQRQKQGRQTAQHQPVVEMSEDHLAVLKSLVERMETMERNYQQTNQGGYGRGKRRGRGRGQGRGRGGQQNDGNDRWDSKRKEETEQKQPATQHSGSLNLKKSPLEGR